MWNALLVVMDFFWSRHGRVGELAHRITGPPTRRDVNCARAIGQNVASRLRSFSIPISNSHFQFARACYARDISAIASNR